MRRQHPSLWRALVVDVVTLTVGGFGYAVLTTPTSVSVIPVRPIGWALMTAGVVLWVGWRRSPRLYAWGMSLAAGVWGFLSMSVAAAIVSGWVNNKPAPSVGSLAAFVFVASQFTIQAGEPHSNPVSEANHASG